MAVDDVVGAMAVARGVLGPGVLEHAVQELGEEPRQLVLRHRGAGAGLDVHQTGPRGYLLDVGAPLSVAPGVDVDRDPLLGEPASHGHHVDVHPPGVPAPGLVTWGGVEADHGHAGRVLAVLPLLGTLWSPGWVGHVTPS